MSETTLSAVIVEDDDRFRSLVKVVLGLIGINSVAEASDGHEAINVLKTFDADVVIMDWAMKGMNGISCTQQIRSGAGGCDPDVPIVMLSGHGGEDAIRLAHEAGVNVYLVKPTSIKPLFAGIQQAMNERRTARRGAV